jgi:hypothetical protein
MENQKKKITQRKFRNNNIILKKNYVISTVLKYTTWLKPLRYCTAILACYCGFH